MKNFVLIGSAGYIAERHMRAIKETGNNLVCCMDKSDVMGKIDSYFPDAEFVFNTRDLEKFLLKNKVDYVSICTPNDLHLFYSKLALHYNCNVICEKPLVLNEEELEELIETEKKSKGKLNVILQLRLHDKIKLLKSLINSDSERLNIDLKYITTRGKWYHKSWKGDFNRSGGLPMNIGVHFFDMLIWIFGEPLSTVMFQANKYKISGITELEKAKVEWKLSVDYNDIPDEIKEKGQRTFRQIIIGNEELEFSEGFTNLHTKSYEQILTGNGFGIEDASPAIKLVNKIQKYAY